MRIHSSITIEAPIFFKAQAKGAEFIKLVPSYDIEYGIVLKMIIPTEHVITLDKGWIRIEYNDDMETFRFRTPSSLLKYFGAEIIVYEDEFRVAGEICRIRRVRGDFSKINHLIKLPKIASYHPYFTKDGRFHISFAFMRNHFPEHLKKDPYIQASLVDQAVINHEILVTVFSGKDLVQGERAFKLKRYEYEMVTPPIHILFQHLGKRISGFHYNSHMVGNSLLVIYTKEVQSHEGCQQRTGRRVPGIRERVVRARRKRAGTLRFEEELRRKKILLDFKRR